MSQVQTFTPDTDDTVTSRRQFWPLWATATGVLGYAATLGLEGRSNAADEVVISDQLFTDLNPVVYRLSMVVGYVTVVLLLILAAQWRRRVEPRVPASTAAHLVPLGLVASAAGLAYGYGWRGSLGAYMPGGMEEGVYDTEGLYVLYLLNDFGAYIGWLGVIVSAGAMVWMGVRERTVSRWLGWFSLLPVVATTGMVVGLGVAGVPGLWAPLWLIVAGLGLTFGRHTITR